MLQSNLNITYIIKSLECNHKMAKHAPKKQNMYQKRKQNMHQTSVQLKGG